MPLLLWDALAWIFGMFPLLTGGVWIHQPHLKLELSELAIPVLALALLAFLMEKTTGRSWKESSAARALFWAWREWRKLVTRRPITALWGTSLAVASVWALSSLRRHWAFGSGASDLGIFTSAIWNLTHGHGYVSSVKAGMNLFGDHQSPTFWALAPLFRLLPRPETLLIAQAVGLSLGGPALSALARQALGRSHWSVAALPLLYWAYLPIRNANAFDFHPEVFMLPLFLWGIVGIQASTLRARLGGALALLLALGCKESAGPVAAGVGLAWLAGAAPLSLSESARRLTRLTGLVLIPLGVIVFWFDTKVVPGLLGGTYPYQDSYRHLGGGGLASLAIAPFKHPELFFGHLLGPARIKFLVFTLAPLAFLPLFHPRALIAALPGYAMLFLSEGDHRVSPLYHYAIEPSVGLFWALPGAIAWLERRPVRRIPLSTWILFFALLSFGRSELLRIRKLEPTPRQKWLSSQLLPSVAPEVSLSASNVLVPHLANRPWVNHLPRWEIPVPGSQRFVDCILFDQSLNNWPMQDADFQALESLARDPRFKPILQCPGLLMLQRNDAPPCLLREVACPP